MARIAAVVVGLRERLALLGEALASIDAQTRQPDDLVVGIDYSRVGEVWNQNRLLQAVDADWLGFLHDDDLWYPTHLEVAEEHFDTADVIVSRFDMAGRPEHTIEPQHDDFSDLRWTNWFPPSAVVVRREAFDGWLPPTKQFRWVDWRTWNHLLDREARFVHTNEVTMTYRFHHGQNGSWGG